MGASRTGISAQDIESYTIMIMMKAMSAISTSLLLKHFFHVKSLLSALELNTRRKYFQEVDLCYLMKGIRPSSLALLVIISNEGQSSSVWYQLNV